MLLRLGAALLEGRQLQEIRVPPSQILGQLGTHRRISPSRRKQRREVTKRRDRARVNGHQMSKRVLTRAPKGQDLPRSRSPVSTSAAASSAWTSAVYSF